MSKYFWDTWVWLEEHPFALAMTIAVLFVILRALLILLFRYW
jgi:hypothetical protein